MIDRFDPLSPQGLKRRDDILSLARRWASRRRRRRRMLRGAALGALAVAIALLAVISPRPPAPRLPGVEVMRSVTSGPVQSTARQSGTTVLIEWVATEKGLTDRLTAPAQARTWQRLSDRELVDRLAEGGRPAGLAYIQGQEVLLFGTR